MSYTHRAVFVARKAAATLTLTFLTLWGASPAAAAANCSEANFRLPQSFDMTSAPSAFVTADFNGDGRPDIAASGANGVEVRLNDGSGWFGVPRHFNTGDFPDGLGAADFNGDGRTDLLVANSDRSDVSLLLGDGAGGFAAPVNINVGARTLSVLAADFNGDGKADAAVGYFGEGNAGFVSVLLGDGAGGLSPAGATQVNGFPDSLVSADFNKDGKRDLALVSSQKPLLLLGDGAGGFAPPSSPTPGFASQLTSADLNGDGNADLALTPVFGDNITLLFGDGAGGFSAPAVAATGPLSSPVSVTAADFNGDGRVDLAAALFGASSAGVLFGDGAGGFSAPRTFGAGSTPGRVLAADFNGDSLNDLVVSTGQNVFGSLTGFKILLGTGGGDFHAARTRHVNTTPFFSSPRKGPTKMALADFNNDGKTDIAVSNNRSVGIDGGGPTISILLADGAGGFNAAPEIKFSQGTNTGAIAAADFNKDGKADIAVSIPSDVFGHAHTVAIYFGDGAGNFAVHGFVSVFTPNDLEVADLNNDSKPDLVVKKDSNFAALLGDGAGGFTVFDGPAGGDSFSDIAVGDFNGDGKQDVTVTDSHNGKVDVTLGAGNGTFDFMRQIDVGFGPLALAVADFNGDQIQDIAVTRTPNFSSGAVTVLLGTGTGLFGTPSSYEIGSEAESVAVADLNGDGKTDLVTGDLFSVGISVLTGNGDGTFRPRVTFDLDSGPAHIVVQDFNADGKPDLGVSQTSAHTVALLLNDLTTPLPCLSVGDASFNEGDAGETEAEFTVTLSGPSDKTVKVNYFLGGFPATVNQDFKGGEGSLTFAPGTTTRTIKVALIGDLVDEEDESFRVTLRSPSNALISDAEALGTILDNDPAPGINVADASAVEGNFNTSGLAFNVTLSAPSSKPITVQYSTSPGTATQTTSGAGDYFFASGTVQFGEGQTTQTINVNAIGDNVRESDETFTLTLSSPTNATVGDGTAQGTIINDDPVPTLSAFPSSTTETPSGSVITVHVNMSNPTDQTVTVAYATKDVTATAGSDYVAASGTLTFNPGEVEKTFDVAVNDDTEDELNETFTVTLSNPTNANASAAPVVYTIFDNDGPTISINDVTVVEGQGGRTLATFTVSLSAASPQPVSVRAATANGTASGNTFPFDFESFSNRFVTFPAGTTTATLTVFVTGDQIIEPDETFFVNLSQPSGGTIADAQGLGTITNDDTTSVRFSTDAVTANEADGSVQVTVQRVGDLTGTFTANYSTFDGTASARSDYIAALGTLRFGPGETSKTITVLITNDALVENAEDFIIFLSGPTGGATDPPSFVNVTLNSDDAAPGPNPIDDPAFFVRQHYRDFLNRDPDASGLAFWTGQMTNCGNPNLEVCRINVSAAFFKSIEFQETGYLVYKTYKASFGDATSPNVPGTVPVIRLNEFLGDTQEIGRGLIVGQGAWQAQLEANKQAYTLEFVQRARFTSAFPSSMTAEQFVDKLALNAGLTLTQAERDNLLSILGPTPSDAAKRAQVLRSVAENPRLHQAEFNRAFVLMEYFGYLRRNPSDAPEPTLNYAGWKFWLGKLEEFNGNFVRAEMVKAFITSDEYRQRFGQ